MSKNHRGARGPAGDAMRASGKDGPQIVNSRGHRWTTKAEALFLDELGASCNVTRAARVAGFSTAAIHRRRRTDAAFADRWRVALEQGYVRIEMLLVQRATEALEGHAPDPDTPIPAMTVKDAITILQTYRAAVATGGKCLTKRARVRSLDEVRDSILTKLDAIEAKRIADERKGSA